MNDNKRLEMHQVYEAYRKLKNYFYYDNNSLFIRQQIADFESDLHKENDDANIKEFLQKKFDFILNIVNNNDDDLLNTYLNEIDFRYYTKTLKTSDDPNKTDNTINTYGSVILNRPRFSDVEVDKLNLVIDAPIELHILSVLWLMLVGSHFSRVISQNNYAYQFVLKDDKEDDHYSSLQLYKPYYIGYQKWRDTALSTALRILDEKQDSTILSLDIKRYFYSVRIDLWDLLKQTSERHAIKIDFNNGLYSRLTTILYQINRAYTDKVINYLDDDINKEGLENSNNTILPVGLLSSGFLGNLVLSDFDEDVVKLINPAYYGRYVDDILFVFSNRKFTGDNFIKQLIDENFVKQGLLVDDGEGDYKLKGHKTLSIQTSKMVMEHFYHNESRAAINKFKDNIDRQRSEFRFLPDEEEIDKEFDNEAFSIQYSESINKLRSIKEYKVDKFGASKFLAHKIFLACQLIHSGSKKEREDLEKSSQQILTFFKDKYCIEFSSLWEKVATYFIINNDKKHFNDFYNQTISTINQIKGSKLSDSKLNKYKDDLRYLLKLSVANPLALNLSFGEKGDNKWHNDCAELAREIRFSNMFRHKIVGITGINYTESLYDPDLNLYSYDTEVKAFDNKYAIYLSPRFVHYDEINVTAIHSVLISNTFDEKHEEDLESAIKSITDSFYHSVNYDWVKLFGTKKQYNITSLYDIKLEDKILYAEVHEYDNPGTSNKRVGIVNLKVPSHYITDSMEKKPVLSTNRRKQLYEIINTAAKDNCEILVLPELSVPFQWLETLMHQSKKHDMAIITGLEYIHGKEDIVYNCVATILPIKRKYYTTAKAFIRVKNHYSPKEIEELIGRRMIIPEVKKYYHLFHWRKCYFSVYNCFELANITDRALFKSKVDFLVATEWNEDINYYADIAGSWVRDVHCYFIQCNTSNYGDSCILRPSKTETSRMVTVKGGENSAVLIDNLDIEELRSFQFKEHNLQMKDKSFKLTPPDFDRKNVEIRESDGQFVQIDS